jgi:sortase A
MRPLRLVGNLLIAISLLSLGYIYWPILKLELVYLLRGQSTISQPVSKDFGIVIDKLGINQSVTKNVDPFDKSAYLPALARGVAHAAGTGLPDQPGSIYLFAHSSDNPFSITRYNTAFYLLDRLTVGDEIKIFYEGRLFRYRVSTSKVVKPWQVEALTEIQSDQLILQTCTPIGTSLNRLLVFATPI